MSCYGFRCFGEVDGWYWDRDRRRFWRWYGGVDVEEKKDCFYSSFVFPFMVKYNNEVVSLIVSCSIQEFIRYIYISSYYFYLSYIITISLFVPLIPYFNIIINSNINYFELIINNQCFISTLSNDWKIFICKNQVFFYSSNCL